MTEHLFPLSRDNAVFTNDDWYTPSWVFDAAGLDFDMDVSAPVEPSLRSVPASQYLTVMEDGLTHAWRGTVWCNPPYSGTAPWVDRWAAHYPSGMLLVPCVKARWIGTALRAADAMTLLRIDFNRPNGEVGETRWLSLLLGKGQGCADAVGRVARRDTGAARGVHFTRPGAA